MGIAWTRRVLRRLSRPEVAAAEVFVTPFSEGWIREFVSRSIGFGQMGISLGPAVHRKIELFRVAVRPEYA